MSTFLVPTEITAILKKVDNLGYDTRSGATNAILSHPDYVERWDLVDGSITLAEYFELEAWKAFTLSTLIAD